MAQHNITGLVGKLTVESEVNCAADTYYYAFKQYEDIPKALAHIYTGVKVIEGHGTTSGCVQQWNYIVAGRHECAIVTTTYHDERRNICYNIFEGDTMKKYKKFYAILEVKPKSDGHGSIVSWIVEYDCIDEHSPVPIDYLGFFQSIIEDLDDYLCASH